MLVNSQTLENSYILKEVISQSSEISFIENSNMAAEGHVKMLSC